MSFIQVLLTAIALSMDAVAVSLGTACRKKAPHSRGILVMALGFGIFQALMPWLGFTLGSAGSAHLMRFDHWIAFALLGFVGGKMLWESFHEEEDAELEIQAGYLPWKTLLLLAIATSIDAAAIGISFSMIGTSIAREALIIGVITFVLSWLAGHFGKRIGEGLGKKAEVLGGLLLIGIGLQILWEHLQ